MSVLRPPRSARLRAAAAPAVLAALALCSVSLSGAPSLAAQQAPTTLTLTVSDDVTARPVAGATVLLPELGLGALTNSRGVVRIRSVPPGRHVVEVRMLGYRSERLRVGFGGEPVVGMVGLELAPIRLEGVRARARARSGALATTGFYDRRRVGQGKFLTRLEIGRVAERSGRFSDALWMLPGLQIQQRSSGAVPIGARGRCAAQVFVDGVRVQGTPDESVAELAQLGRGSAGREQISGAVALQRMRQAIARAPVPIDQLVSAQDVEAVEWYAGESTTPMQFRYPSALGGRTTCGTLVVWTRVK